MLPQSFCKSGGEVLQFINVIWFAEKREGELPGLCKIAIVNLQSLHGTETAGQNIEHIRIEPQRRRENRDAGGSEHSHAAPNERAPLRYGSRDEITDAHALSR
ncbi:MAG: hypothetical protein DME87_09920 [Verrucomicrobia bacterium]|nr:MAG: hypothetical protein DME87_09920 [Verrucomicrobiota bacterium]